MKCSFCGQYVESTGPFCPYCGKTLNPEQLNAPINQPSQQGPYPLASNEHRAAPKKPTGLELWGRYFVHGALFSLILILGAVVWAILTVPLVLCGAFIGLAISLFLFVMMYGYINTFLNDWIWGNKLESKLSTVFVHGLVLILVLLAVSIPSFIIQSAIPHPAVAIALFLIYCFVDGFLGKWVGDLWATPRRRASTYGY